MESFGGKLSSQPVLYEQNKAELFASSWIQLWAIILFQEPANIYSVPVKRAISPRFPENESRLAPLKP